MRSGSGMAKAIYFSKNERCVGTTDGWIAMDFIDAHTRTHAYSLINYFSRLGMPLPELDPIIGNVSDLFEIRKVLMMSPPRGLIAVRTNNSNCPIILVQHGMGVWFPKIQTTMLTHIIDIAFLQDKLYGITTDEDLISLYLAADSHGAPTVTRVECVINHLGDGDSDISTDVLVFDDDDKDGEAENIDYEEANEWLVSEGEETDYDYETACDDEFALADEVEDDYWEKIANRNDEFAPSEEEEVKHVVQEFNITHDDMLFKLDDDEPYEDLILTIRYLVESRGKLLMLRRQVQHSFDATRFTRRVEVFEADTTTRTWVPLSSGLDGHALFISKRFSKSVSAGGEIEEDAIYFIDTGELFNMRSKTTSPPNILSEYEMSCLFIPGSF
jgi:hypothetical protein